MNFNRRRSIRIQYRARNIEYFWDLIPQPLLLSQWAIHLLSGSQIFYTYECFDCCYDALNRQVILWHWIFQNQTKYSHEHTHTLELSQRHFIIIRGFRAPFAHEGGGRSRTSLHPLLSTPPLRGRVHRSTNPSRRPLANPKTFISNYQRGMNASGRSSTGRGRQLPLKNPTPTPWGDQWGASRTSLHPRPGCNLHPQPP